MIMHIDHNSERNGMIDKLTALLVENLPIEDSPVTDIFIDGIYAREMEGKPDTIIISEIHRTRHLFIVSQGTMTVWGEDGKETVIQAPYKGITEPGTRRYAYVWPYESCFWTTIHANPNNENVLEIKNRIIEPHDNVYLTNGLKEKINNIKGKIKNTLLTY